MRDTAQSQLGSLAVAGLLHSVGKLEPIVVSCFPSEHGNPLFEQRKSMSEALSTDKPLETPDAVESSGLQLTERDIVFSCPHCQEELVVDKDGAGMALACSHCGKTVTIPQYAGPSLHFLQAATSKLADALEHARRSGPREFRFEGQGPTELAVHQRELERQVRETQAQISDLREQINHTRIQLHRYQLKLEMLKERELELKAEIDAVRSAFQRSA
jgi:DNA-directed RNA polymerase subunit M/transcription elongation factor TFIIS